MSHLYLVMFFGLSAAVGWGVSDFIGAKASKSLGPIMSAFLISTIGTLVYVAAYCAFLHTPVKLTAPVFWYAVGGGLAVALGSMAFFKGLAAGPVSLVSPLSAAYPLVTTALALSVFHAHLSHLQVSGIALIVVGVMLASEIIGKQKINQKRIGTGPLFALLCAIFWGVGYSLVAQATQRSNWQMTTLIEFIAIVLGFGLALPFVKGSETISWKAIKQTLNSRLIISAALVQFAAGLCFNIGLSHEVSSGAIVSALSACYPALTIILALRHFDETVEPLPMIGASMCIVGVIITSLR